MNYSNSDIGSMRRDALRRTREIHKQNTAYEKAQAERKAAAPEGGADNESDGEKKASGEQHAEDHSAVPPENKKVSNGSLNGLISGLFSGGKLDSDKIIIIALIIILAREGADIKLLIALGYILM